MGQVDQCTRNSSYGVVGNLTLTPFSIIVGQQLPTKQSNADHLAIPSDRLIGWNSGG